jgi:hypothetical protein
MYFGFLIASITFFVIVIIAITFDRDGRFSRTVIDHIATVLGFTTGSGGIGTLLRYMDQREQDNLRFQQAILLAESLPPDKRDRAITELIKSRVKAAGR